MDRKYGTLDLPKRSEQMKGIYLKIVILISQNKNKNKKHLDFKQVKTAVYGSLW